MNRTEHLGEWTLTRSCKVRGTLFSPAALARNARIRAIVRHDGIEVQLAARGMDGREYVHVRADVPGMRHSPARVAWLEWHEAVRS